jgi:leader peptidase (prepilin peptidase)/N-methyltransferase
MINLFVFDTGFSISILLFFFGTIFGSAANALIDRLPRGEAWHKGRSKCDKCGKILGWIELIPVVSYLWLGGKCKHCHSPIPVRNLIVELVCGVAFVVMLGHAWAYSSFILVGMFWVSLVIFVMDMETRLVSEVMVLMLLILGVGWQLAVGPAVAGQASWQLVPNLAGLAFGVISIGGLWLFSKGRGMGFGDVEIAAAMGLFLGWPKIILVLWIAFVGGGAVGCWLLAVSKRDRKSEIAFGPFLIAGMWAALVWGDAILGFARHGFFVV